MKLSVLLSIFLTGGAFAAEGDVEELKRATSVQSVKVYEEGRVSEMTAAFLKILGEANADAEAQFKQVFKKARNDEGRVYALIGLHKLKSPLFETLAAKLEAGKEIQFQVQCSKESMTVSETLGLLKDGRLYGTLFGIELKPPAKDAGEPGPIKGSGN